MRHLDRYYDRAAQEQLVGAVLDVLAQAPLFTPAMPGSGNPFSVAMSNCGPLGWVSDKVGGYRYQARHPDSGAAWPAMPQMLLDLPAWRRRPPPNMLQRYDAPLNILRILSKNCQ